MEALVNKALSEDTITWLFGLAYWIASSDKTIHPAEIDWLKSEFGEDRCIKLTTTFKGYRHRDYFTHTTQGAAKLSDDEKRHIFPCLHAWLVSLATADDVFAVQERMMIRRILKRTGLLKLIAEAARQGRPYNRIAPFGRTPSQTWKRGHFSAD